MYRIIGSDGKEYGPVDAEQIRKWIREGRANATSRVQAEGASSWKTLAEFPELMGSPAAPQTPPMPGTTGWPPARDQVKGPATGLIDSWAMASSILALAPCVSPCCVVGLPIGIWSLVVLSQPEVKSAFLSGATAHG
jgi:hypothetical protein